MAMPALASIEDLALFPNLRDLDLSKLTGALAAASALVRAYTRVGKPDGWVNTDNTLQAVPDPVVQATLFIARRVVLMPESGVSEETAGPFTVRRDNSLFLSVTEKTLLAQWSTSGGGAISITTCGPLSDGVPL
jgi:hypothetical protein